MKSVNKALSLFLALVCVMSLLVFSVSASEVTPKNVAVNRYSTKSYNVKKTKTQQKYTLKYSIKNNSNNYVKVRFLDWGENYILDITGKKLTTKNYPVITVYYKNGDTKVTVKQYKITVNDMEKTSFSDVKINKGTKKSVTLINPYYKDYDFKLSDSKIANIDMGYMRNDTKVTYKIKGLKKGETNVSVYLANTKVKVGSFKVTVGTFPTTVKKSYKNITLKYNSHGSNAYMSKSHVMLKNILKDKKAKTTYSVKSSNENVVSYLSSGEIYATGTGKATCTVYEKTGKSKKTEIDTFTVTVTKADMAYVVEENALWYNDGIFGQGNLIEYLNLTDNKTLKIEGIIKSHLINNTNLGSHFKSSLYKITYKSGNTKVAKVSSKGVVTAKAVGDARITYTITFTDGSVYKDVCDVSVETDNS